MLRLRLLGHDRLGAIKLTLLGARKETPELLALCQAVVPGSSAAALTARPACLRLLGHGPLGATNFGLGTMEMTPELGDAF